MFRKPMIAGNWKMHGSSQFIDHFILQFRHHDYSNIDVLICPPYVYLAQAHTLLQNTQIALGAQNLYVHDEGAFTGEVAAPMLADVGCQYVLIGHSERRVLFHEENELLAQKALAARAWNLIPIICVGETQYEREQGLTHDVIAKQVLPLIDRLGITFFEHAMLAYEPIWAIGSGLTATPEQAQAVHAYIRELFFKNHVDIATHLRILYGGSMKAQNAKSLLAMPDIDGGLIGGASLDVEQFVTICKIASDMAFAAKC